MRAVELTLTHARIPLRKQVRHASAVRDYSDNLIVRTRLEDGTMGVGEGVPRPYVTGETIEGAFEQLARSNLASQLGPVGSFEEAVQMCAGLELYQPRPDPRGCYGNAARCALELSLLDAFGRYFRCPLSAATGVVAEARDIARSASQVRYSGVITAERPLGELYMACKIRLYRFRDCKIKVGVAGQDDRARLGRLRRVLGRKVRIRVDANEAWRPDNLVQRVRQLVPFGVVSVEQPLPHDQVGALGELRRELPVPVMHDESLCSLRDARLAIEQQTADLFNIRLSKCGGFVHSLSIAALAHRHGLGYQLGCQVGETGVLSAAGRHFATSVAGIRFLEGSYDRHLVAEPLTDQDLTFGYGGRAPALQGPGLGITLNTAALARLALREEHIHLA